MPSHFICTTLLFTAMLSISAVAQTQQSFNDVYNQYNSAKEDGNKADAAKYAEQALALGRVKFGELSENTANLKYNLALSLADNQQSGKAFSMFSIVINDYVDLYGKYSEQHYDVMLEQLLSIRDFPRDKLNSFRSEFKRAVSKAEDAAEFRANASPENAGVTYYRFARALNMTILVNDLFRRVEDINELTEEYLLAQFGENDMRTLEIRFMLGKFSKGRGKSNEAIEYFEKVVSTVTKQLTTSHPYELAAHAALVDLYERKGKSDKATQHCIAIGKMTPWNDEIEPIPLFRANPDYPINMVMRDNDGWAELEFVISSLGFVKDIKVLNSSHESFANKSKKALAKWRYAPKIENGDAVDSEKLKVRIDFVLG